MDIIESLLSLGSGVIDSMISTSERYSKDKRFTTEGREYYKELHEGLTMAKGNLDKYKKKRESSAFKKLQIDESENLKLATQRDSVNILRVYNLIEAYFGGYRGQDFEDTKRELFHFFDKKCPIITALFEYVKEPCRGQKFDVFPILALGITQDVWTGFRFKINKDNFLVFCAEGIAFGRDKDSSKYTVIPYKDIEKVYRDERHQESFLLGRIQYRYLYFKPIGYSKEYNMPCIRFSSELSESSKKLISNSIYEFIRCFNPNCTYEEKKGVMK